MGDAVWDFKTRAGDQDIGTPKRMAKLNERAYVELIGKFTSGFGRAPKS